jgi:hypothetical protein
MLACWMICNGARINRTKSYESTLHRAPISGRLPPTGLPKVGAANAQKVEGRQSPSSTHATGSGPPPLRISPGTHLQVSWLDHETLPLDAGDKRQREPQQSRHATHTAPHQHCQLCWHRLNLTRMGNGATVSAQTCLGGSRLDRANRANTAISHLVGTLSNTPSPGGCVDLQHVWRTIVLGPTGHHAPEWSDTVHSNAKARTRGHGLPTLVDAHFSSASSCRPLDTHDAADGDSDGRTAGSRGSDAAPCRRDSHDSGEGQTSWCEQQRGHCFPRGSRISLLTACVCTSKCG